MSCLSSSFTHNPIHQKSDSFLCYISSVYFHTQVHYPNTTILSFLDYSYSFIIDLPDFSLISYQSKFYTESSKEHMISSLFNLNANVVSDAL